MVAKDEAELLIDKFMPFSDYNECDVFTQRKNQLKNAKQCALICVDEVIKSHYKVFVGVLPSIERYWIEVKEEINKL